MAKRPKSCWRKPPTNWLKRRCRRIESYGSVSPRSFNAVMPGLVPGIHVLFLCAAMTRTAIDVARHFSLNIAGVQLIADLSGALFWEEQSLLVVSDLHLEKESSFATRGVLLPPYDTVATLGRLATVIARHDPRMVIALGDSFHDRDAHGRLSAPDRASIAALQARRDWIWISGNHDPALPSHLGGVVAHEVALAPIAFRHEPNGAVRSL